jgi:hypothetical protein
MGAHRQGAGDGLLRLLAALLITGGLVLGCGGTTPTLTPLVTPGSSAPTGTGTTPQASGTTSQPSGAIPVVTTPRIQTTASDSTWTVSFDKPVVGGVPAADSMNTAITTAINGIVDEFKSLAYAGGTITLNGRYEVALKSARLLSIRIAYDQDTGGASGPNFYASSLNFEAQTGEAIDMPFLFLESASWVELLSTESRSLLPAAIGSYADPSTIESGTKPLLSNFDTAWVITNSGLEVAFQQGQVAAMAKGIVKIVIPWSHLAGVIDPAGPAGEFV